MAELLLIVRFAGQRLALRASEIESVVEIETLTPVPRAAAHVSGLASLRSRVLTVIDCAASLDPATRLPDDCREAVVAVLDGHPYALLVEAVEDVVEGSSSEETLAGLSSSGWARITKGLVEADGDLLLLLDLAAIVSGARAEAA